MGAGSCCLLCPSDGASSFTEGYPCEKLFSFVGFCLCSFVFVLFVFVFLSLFVATASFYRVWPSFCVLGLAFWVWGRRRGGRRGGKERSKKVKSLPSSSGSRGCFCFLGSGFAFVAWSFFFWSRLPLGLGVDLPSQILIRSPLKRGHFSCTRSRSPRKSMRILRSRRLWKHTKV